MHSDQARAKHIYQLQSTKTHTNTHMQAFFLKFWFALDLPLSCNQAHLHLRTWEEQKLKLQTQIMTFSSKKTRHHTLTTSSQQQNTYMQGIQCHLSAQTKQKLGMRNLMHAWSDLPSMVVRLHFHYNSPLFPWIQEDWEEKLKEKGRGLPSVIFFEGEGRGSFLVLQVMKVLVPHLFIGEEFSLNPFQSLHSLICLQRSLHPINLLEQNPPFYNCF